MKKFMNTVTSIETGKKEDVIVKTAFPFNAKATIVGGALILGGIYILGLGSFFKGARAYDEAELTALEKIGAI